MKRVAMIAFFALFLFFSVVAPSHAIFEWIIGTIISVGMASRGPDIVSQYLMDFTADLKYQGECYFSSTERASYKIVILNKQFYKENPDAVGQTEIVIKPFPSDGVQKGEKTEEIFWQVGGDETVRVPIENGRLVIKLSDLVAKYGIESYPINIMAAGEDSTYYGIAVCQIVFK